MIAVRVVNIDMSLYVLGKKSRRSYKKSWKIVNVILLMCNSRIELYVISFDIGSHFHDIFSTKKKKHQQAVFISTFVWRLFFFIHMQNTWCGQVTKKSSWKHRDLKQHKYLLRIKNACRDVLSKLHKTQFIDNR